MFPADRRAEALAGATHVLLTNGHGDHLGDAVSIARDLGIPVAGIYDLVTWLGAREGIEVIGFNKGGTISPGGARVTMVNAVHSSSASGPDGPVAVGSEAGFMIAGEGHVVYVSGDTDLMADMEWMADLHKPDIGILSCGGHFTMDMERAAYASRRWFNFRTIIPCHYRTFPILAQDATALRAGLPPGAQVIEPQVLEPITL
jgi:L-ascorbate metabolism protein UlaG (beta-lactamase superfamily)